MFDYLLTEEQRKLRDQVRDLVLAAEALESGVLSEKVYE